MPDLKDLPVKQLSLDLRNFRTTPQTSESKAIKAMISVNPEWFWALTESLLDDGYHITENILVLQEGKGQYVVKEGNRRVAALKLILGQVAKRGLDIPENLVERMGKVTAAWKKANGEVPCAIYARTEAKVVDRIVALTHGKGQKAGRDTWKAVARARHNRDMEGASEPGLDVLEAYLKHGENLTQLQSQRWAGDYPLTVLDEVLKHLAQRFSASSAKELADQYPKKIAHREKFERILNDIGQKLLGYKAIREEKEDFAVNKYGLPPEKSDTEPSKPGAASSASSTATTATTATNAAAKRRALAADDPRGVIRQLRKFSPVGNHREKLVTLKNEAVRLKLEKHPHAFCFLLRSMFEISAKAYCKDHARRAGCPKTTKADGSDRPLVDVLRDITNDLTQNKTDKAMLKALHGAMTEMAKSDGLLSVTSLNQLVHNPRFSVNAHDISTLYYNIAPLLEEMNA